MSNTISSLVAGKSKSTRLAAAFFVISLIVSAQTLLAGVDDRELEAGTGSVVYAEDQERLEAELITIRPTGFEPASITRPRGKFLLAVNNRTGLDEVSLQLDSQAGARQDSVRLSRKHHGWRKLVDLPPGRYVLRETNHPDWVCHITISAR